MKNFTIPYLFFTAIFLLLTSQQLNAQCTTTDLTITMSGTNEYCGNSNGTVTSVVTGGTAPYTYIWNNGAMTADLTGVPAGSYQLLVTDAEGCIATATTSTGGGTCDVNVDFQSGIAFDPIAEPGWQNVTVQGTDPWIYRDFGGDVFAHIQGYQAASAQLETWLISPPIDLTSQKVLNFETETAFWAHDGLDVFISTNYIGDVATATWTNLNPTLAGSTNTNYERVASGDVNLPVGTAGFIAFRYIGDNTANTSTYRIDNITICEPTNTVVLENINVTLDMTLSPTDEECGTLNGAASVSITNGVAPFAFAWNNGGDTNPLQGIAAGDYIVTVTDANGCTGTGMVTVGASNTNCADLCGQIEMALTASMDESCSNGMGSISIESLGGAAPYTYQWNNGMSGSSISGLSAGTYAVTVTDANGCVDEGMNIGDCDVLTDFQDGVAFDPVMETGWTNVAVQGVETWIYRDFNGDVFAHMQSFQSTSAHNETWLVSPSIDLSTQKILNFETETAFWGHDGLTVWFSNDFSGDVTTATWSQLNPRLAGMNESNYERIFSGDVYLPTGGTGYVGFEYRGNPVDSTSTYRIDNVLICSPASFTIGNTIEEITISETVQNETCGNASGEIAVTASGGDGNYSYSWNTGGMMSTLQNVSAGDYTVIVTDGNGCSAEKTITVGNTVNEIMISETIQQASCGNASGEIAVTASGGDGNYSYSWNTGGMMSVLQNLMAGDYIVIVTDGNGCSAEKTITVGNQDGPTAQIAQQSNPTCNGGSDGAVDIAVTGGTSPYTFLWEDGTMTSNLANLTGGTYICTVTDVNMCSSSITAMIIEPAEISIVPLSLTDVTCNGGNDGAIVVDVIGGTGDYTFAWDNGADTKDLMGIEAGSYVLVVTDANGCTGSSATFNINESDALSAEYMTMTNVSCNGAADGSVEVAASGGIMPYAYAWSNQETTAGISGLSVGMYDVTVTDANGCTLVLPETTISEPDVLELIVDDIQTAGDTDNGAISITVTGGVGSYTYTWSNGGMTEDISNLAEGEYTVTVTDGNDCTLVEAIYVPMAISVEDLETVSDFSLFPNPTSDIIRIQMELNNHTDVVINIYNTQGQLLKQKEFSSTTAVNSELNVDSWPAGIYWMEIKLPEGFFTERFVVE